MLFFIFDCDRSFIVTSRGDNNRNNAVAFSPECPGELLSRMMSERVYSNNKNENTDGHALHPDDWQYIALCRVKRNETNFGELFRDRKTDFYHLKLI